MKYTRALAAVATLCAFAAGAAEAQTPGDTITLTNQTGSAISNYPLQFGRPFVEGAVPHSPQVSIGSTPLLTQADVKNRYPDGSVEFAVIAVVVPSLPAGTPTVLTLSDATGSPPITTTVPVSGTIRGNLTGTHNGFLQGFPSFTGPAGANGIAVGTMAGTLVTPEGNTSITISVNQASTAGANVVSVSKQVQVAYVNPYSVGVTGTVAVTQPGSGGGVNQAGNSPLTQAQMLDPSYNFDAAMIFTPTGSAPTTRISARTMLQNGDYTLWTSGPIAQTIVLGDDSTVRKYDVGFGDGFHPVRPRIYATFWPATKQVFVRATAESGLTTEYEDANYKVSVALGAINPQTVYSADLSGNLPSPITGLSFAPCNAAPPAGGVQSGPCNGADYASGYAGNLVNIQGTPSAPIPVTANGHFPAEIVTDHDVNIVEFKNTGVPGQLYLYNQNEPGSSGDANFWPAIPAGTPFTISASWPIAHWAGSAWDKSFWLTNGAAGGAPPQQVDIDNNLPYLESTRFIPNFDPANTIDPVGGIEAEYANWTKTPNDIYDGNWDNTGFWYSYMGSPGARQDISPMPEWSLLWLYTGDWRMRTMALGMSDLAASWPYHLRETDPSKILNRGDMAGSGLGHEASIIGRPTLLTWTGDLNYGGTTAQDKINFVGKVDPGNPWYIEGSHQPDAFFPEYVATGDPFYLNEMEEFAMFGVARYTPDGNNAGTRGPDGTYGAAYDELRGHAWVYRDRAEAAFAAPDGTPEKTYLTAMTNDMIARDEGGMQITGTPYDGSLIKSWGASVGNYFTSQQNGALGPQSPIGMWWTSGQPTSFVTNVQVVNPGSGGTPGPVTVEGTSGWGNRFQVTGTVNSAGQLAGPLALTSSDNSYGSLPTTPAAEPVVAVSGGGGLTGATVSVTNNPSSCDGNDAASGGAGWFQQGSCGSVMDVWTQWYLQYGLGRAAELGFAAKPLDLWTGRFLVNALAGSNPKLITMYEQPATHLPSVPDAHPAYYQEWSPSASQPSFVDASADAPVYVVNPGSGGTPGPVTIAGTTGTGTKFTATATINSAGQLIQPITLATPGSYTVDPKYSANEPVMPVSGGGGLVGATVALPMSDIESALTYEYLTGPSPIPGNGQASLNDYWNGNLWSQGRPVYAMAGLAMLVDEGAPGAAAEWPWMKANVHDPVIGANPGFTQDPSFDLVPRTDTNVLPPIPTSLQ